jgi:hypothetical protein
MRSLFGTVQLTRVDEVLTDYRKHSVSAFLRQTHNIYQHLAPRLHALFKEIKECRTPWERDEDPGEPFIGDHR